MVLLRLTLQPLEAMANDNYPIEVVTLIVMTDGRIFALPSGSGRPWHHRMPEGLRELCLWYVRDRPDLKWSWEFGLETLITIIHRHVMAEEYFRRHPGHWPIEEAPHGLGPHPDIPPELLATPGSRRSMEAPA